MPKGGSMFSSTMAYPVFEKNSNYVHYFPKSRTFKFLSEKGFHMSEKEIMQMLKEAKVYAITS